MGRTDDAIQRGEIDPHAKRMMPPTDRFTGRTYYGLGEGYPVENDGFAEGQAESAKWMVYKGISDGSQWHLADGTLLELWPDGSIFNEYGTLVGTLKLVAFGEKPESRGSR